MHEDPMTQKIINDTWADFRKKQHEKYIASLKEENEKLKARFKAPIVCLCGSTRFKQTWIEENKRLSNLGWIVLSVGLWGHCEKQFPDEAHKARLDKLHKQKIDLADWVYILDVNGYIGESTRSEIEYATNLGKPIGFLSNEFPDYVEPLDEYGEKLKRYKAMYGELE